MELTINEYKKPFWIGVGLDSVITRENFHQVDMHHTFRGDDFTDIQFAFHCNLGSITVLDRMTGFSFGRDTETGYRDPDGKFWLASGMFDIRKHMPISLKDAIELIKANANNCVGE